MPVGFNWDFLEECINTYIANLYFFLRGFASKKRGFAPQVFRWTLQREVKIWLLIHRESGPTRVAFLFETNARIELQAQRYTIALQIPDVFERQAVA
jgi:hypothetical protein